jgi:putative CocE/NonD family hydrolase
MSGEVERRLETSAAAEDKRSGAGRRRTLSQVAWDALGSRKYKLPRATHRYTTIRDARIPMRDGVELLADVLLPVGRPKGTVLLRSPYGWSDMLSGLTTSMYARHGYIVVLARCRGTFGSGGRFQPFADERADGMDTVEWLRRQRWFTGTFATLGGSYGGFTQLAILTDPPPELVTSVIATTCHDFRRGIYRDGAFSLDTMFDWTAAVLRQESGFVKSLIAARKGAKSDAASKRLLPMVQGGAEAFGARAPWYRRWLSERNLNDASWAGYDVTEALDRLEIPVLIQMGWQDIFLDQGIEEVIRLQERGVDVAVTAGPWTHRGMVLEGGEVTVGESLRWLDEHLAKLPVRRSAPVRVFVNGADEWLDLASWPPASREVAFFPAESGLLDTHPTATEAVASFTYRPEDPTPALGGPLIGEGGGYADDSAFGARHDVLLFTSAPLTEPLRIIGSPRVELAHQTSNPHADLFVRVSIVDTKGMSRNVTEGFTRLDPAAASGSLELTLDPTGQDFGVGERIRLIVAGGSFPRWERNLGTGENPATSAAHAPSLRTIALKRSRLVLPVVPIAS